MAQTEEKLTKIPVGIFKECIVEFKLTLKSELKDCRCLKKTGYLKNYEHLKHDETHLLKPHSEG